MDGTSSGCYVVDTDFNVVNINDVARNIYPQLEIGAKCYSCLMQLDHPCAMCPITNGVKGPRTYIDPIRHIAETVDALDIDIAGHGPCHAMIFSTVGTDADFAATLPTTEDELRDLALVRALTLDYVDVFSLSLDDGSVTIYRHNNHSLDAHSILRQEKSYMLGLESYIEKYVAPEDQDMMRRRNSIRHIREKLRDSEYFDVHYHVMLHDEMHYYYRRLVRIGAAEDFAHVVIGVACEDDIVRMQNEHLTLEKNLSEVEYDALTGLYTREAFYLHGSQLLQTWPDKDFDFCIMHVENLGLINHRFGHGAGDHLLELIGKLLQNYVTDTSCISYFGNGTYVSLTEYTSTEVRKKNIYTFRSAILHGSELKDISPKWSIYKRIGRDLSLVEIFEKTSFALSTIRTNMHEDYVEFDLAMMDRMEWEESIVNRFDDILLSEQFTAWYQPKYSVRTRRIVGAEALVRWITPEGKMISPGAFIPVLESSGKISQLDSYMFRLVCRVQQKLRDSGYSPIPISVNLSRASVFSDHIAESYSRYAADAGIEPGSIPIEITETSAAENEALCVLARELTAKGFDLHMDDFGMGYSSLASLHSLPFSCIKIDKSLVGFIGNESGESLLRHTIAFARESGKTIIAEGVENYEQYIFLKYAGCDIIQGYYFSKPVNEETFLQLLRDDQSTGDPA